MQSAMQSTAIAEMVAATLKEDVGSGDITAELIAKKTTAHATIKTRETAVICGIPWVEEVYRQLDPSITFKWYVEEGQRVAADDLLVELSGLARSLVTGERCALNWLQTLSGTATEVAKYVANLNGTRTQLLDTRKTLPGLRYAQKYAVRIGGGMNHRSGLYDAFLIKENHIMSCGSIENAIYQARELYSNKKIEVEVENLDELQQSLNAKADIIMLDNFDLETIKQAVIINQGQAKLEVSGNIDLNNLKQIAATGVDYISVGSLTKHVRAIDFSMRIFGAQL